MPFPGNAPAIVTPDPGSTAAAVVAGKTLRQWMADVAPELNGVGGWLYNAPRIGVSKLADQAITSATNTPISWTTEMYDPVGMHDNTTNNSRITIPTGGGGQYLIVGILWWAASGAGSRTYHVFLNGSNQYNDIRLPLGAGTVTYQQILFMGRANAGDYYEIYVEQDSGGSLNIVQYSNVQWLRVAV